MKAKDTSLLTIMRNATQSITLVYQRTYSWKLEQCEHARPTIKNTLIAE